MTSKDSVSDFLWRFLRLCDTLPFVVSIASPADEATRRGFPACLRLTHGVQFSSAGDLSSFASSSSHSNAPNASGSPACHLSRSRETGPPELGSTSSPNPGASKTSSSLLILRFLPPAVWFITLVCLLIVAAKRMKAGQLVKHPHHSLTIDPAVSVMADANSLNHPELPTNMLVSGAVISNAIS